MSQEDLDETPCKILRPNQMLIHTTLHTLDAYSISSGSVALLRVRRLPDRGRISTRVFRCSRGSQIARGVY